MLLVRSDSLDAHTNLAAEELLMERVGEFGSILFLWQSRKAVVIGKNQNPWKECRWRKLFSEGGQLGRRVSGGGAVYQDEGNLNYCFFIERGQYKPDEPYERVIEALDTLGIPAARSGKSSIYAGGRKVSGNAFCLRKNAAMHHGTLLVSTDMEPLHDCLVLNPAPIQDKAVASIPAKTVNLSELRSGLQVSDVRSALADAFGSVYGHDETAGLELLDRNSLLKETEKHAGWDWLFGHTPVFETELPGIGWFQVKKGLIQQVRLTQPVNEDVKGKTFTPESLSLPQCSTDWF